MIGLLADSYPEIEINADTIGNCLEALSEKYGTEFYSFGLVESGGGYQFLTKKQFHPTIAKLNGDKFLKRLSTAALETLSIISYKQPITKPDIEYIRGVNCDYSIQKLLEKELIIISGRNEDAVGKPLLYSTSKSFMDYLGINSMDDMPRLKEVVGEDIVIPTSGLAAVPENEETVMVISQDGELKEVDKAEIVTETIADAPKEESAQQNTEENKDESNGDEEAPTKK
jgi:segregation and condensation protein B